MGDGLFQKVQDGYAFLSYVWDPGDDIFLFGFSRGAYIARSLAGMIAFLGVQNKNLDNQTVREIFCAYRLTNHAQRQTPLRGDAKVPAIKSLLGRLLNSRCSQTPRAMIIQGRSEEGRLGRPSRRLPDFHNLVNDCGPVCHGDPYQDCLDW